MIKLGYYLEQRCKHLLQGISNHGNSLLLKDKWLLEEISKVSPYASMVKEASFSVVFLGNEKFLKYPENWEQDFSVACENFLIEAVSLDLGAVWLGISPLEERMTFIKNIFKLPESVKPFAVVPVGYPKAENKFVDRFEEKCIYIDSYIK
jgi:nitroreductase